MIDYRIHWQSWRWPPCRRGRSKAQYGWRNGWGEATTVEGEITCPKCLRMLALAHNVEREAWIRAHPWLYEAAMTQGWLLPGTPRPLDDTGGQVTEDGRAYG
jgi:hypothetical protein